MKTIKLLFVVGLFISGLQAEAQYELHYALKLQSINSEKITEAEYPTVLSVLNGELKATDINLLNKELVKYETDNSDDINYTGETDRVGGTVSDITNILNPTVSQGDILVAISDVLISRAKQELAIAYFDDMRKAMIEPRKIKSDGITINYTLKDLFPHLYLLVAHIDGSLNMQIGNIFKAAMQRDIAELEGNIYDILPDTLTKKASFSAYRGLRLVVEELKLNTHPAIIIDKLQVGKATNEIDKAFNLMAVLSNSALSYPNGATVAWVSKANLSQLNLKGYKIYLSLLYINPAVSTVLKESGIKKEHLSEKYRQFVLLVSRLENLEIPKFLQEDWAGAYNAGKANSPAPANVRPQLASLLDAIPMEHLMAVVKEVINYSGKDYLPIWDEANELVGYGKEFHQHITDQEYGAAVLSSLRILEHYIPVDSMPKELMKYITLAADIAQADSASQVKAIFESAIMPVGSYKVKRRSAMTTTINAYVGVTAGKENLEGVDAKSSGMYISPFMPIGVETSWSKGTEDKAAKSTSLFFQIIDLGGLMSYHLGESEKDVQVESDSVLRFKHVLAPGINIMRGFKDSPLTLGFGANYSPQLRQITKTGEAKTMATAFRFGVSLSVDIPLFQISVRGPKKEKTSSKPDKKTNEKGKKKDLKQT